MKILTEEQLMELDKELILFGTAFIQINSLPDDTLEVKILKTEEVKLCQPLTTTNPTATPS